MDEPDDHNTARAHLRASCLYQETRLSVDAHSSKAVVDVPVVTSNPSAFASRASAKRRRVDRARATQDEASFARAHLASESSIHFRPANDDQNHPRPRSVLWRILDGCRTLELQPIELYQDPPQDEEPFLTLRFEFPDSIVQGAIAFSEQKEEDGASTLLVFTITQDGNLVTLALPQEAFVKRDFFESPTASLRWSHIRNIPAFAAHKVYRIYTTSQDVLWASLIDGSLVRLDRYNIGSDHEWRQTHFTSGDWKTSFRGLVAWGSQRTVRYGEQDVDAKAATTICPSPSGRHVWTACLDHTIRAWDVSSGRVAATLDMAGDPDRDHERPAPHLLDPNQPQLLRFRNTRSVGDDDGYIMATYSPVTQEFIFWAVDASLSGKVDISNLYSGFHFRPPIDGLTGSPGWRLEQFYTVASSNAQSHDWRLWLSVRVGPRCHLYTIAFNAHLPKKKLQKAWESEWCLVDRGRSTAQELRSSPANPLNQTVSSTDMALAPLTERWLNFLLHPGNFSQAELETALVVYQTGSQKSRRTGSLTRPSQARLRDRLGATIGQNCVINQSTSVESAFDASKPELAAQWSIYYGLVNDLRKQRERHLSLALDEYRQVPWLVMADHISSVRNVSQLEMLWHNRVAYEHSREMELQDPLLRNLSDRDNIQIGQLFRVLSSFRESFSDDFVLVFERALAADALSQDYSVAIEERLLWVYERSGMAGKVSDDDYAQLTEALTTLGGFEDLSKSTFDKAIEFLHAQQHGNPQHKQINPYGCRTMTSGAQDTLALGREVLVDAALLIIFIAVELVSDDYSAELQPHRVFENISSKYREYELLSWLANTRSRAEDAKSQDDEDVGSTVLLESLFSGDWRDIRTPDAPEQTLLMYWIRVWTFGPRLTEQYNAIVPDILAVLFTAGDLDHASEFARFLPKTAWASYVKARYLLMIGYFGDAADCFEKAAPELSDRENEESYDDHNRLLQVTDRDSLKDGEARFFQHVASLFEKAHAMSYVAQYSKLALEACKEEDHDQDTSLKSDLLSRWFTASIHVSRFEEAFQALTDYTDTALRRAALHSFIKNIITAGQTTLLLSLPFPFDLAQEADTYLGTLCSTSSTTASSITKITTTPPHKILFAFRTHRSDHRGAASTLYTHIQQLKARQSFHSSADPDDDLKDCYLSCINSLLLVDEGMRWLLVRPLPATSAPRKARFADDFTLGNTSKDSGKPMRKVVTLDDVRREWQAELDRAADVEAGRYPLEMDGLDFGLDGEVEGGTNGMPGGFGSGSGMMDRSGGAMEV